MDNLLLQLDAKDTASPVLKRFANNTRDAGKGINSLGKNLKDAAGEIPGLGNAMSVMGKGPLVALAAGGVAVATGFAMMIKSSIDMADNMNDMSIKLGISTEKLSVLKLYADQSGTSLEDVADSMAKLGVKLANGDKELAKLGITASTTDEAFYQVADRIAATEDPMLRLKIATDAFGKSGKDMLPMLVQGGDALRKMSQEAPIVSTEFAKMADEFNDKMAVMKGRITTIGLGIAEAVLPQLDKWLDGVDRIRIAFGMLNQEEQKTKEKADIIEKFAELQEKRKAGEKLIGPVKGAITLDGKTLSQQLADIDKKYEPKVEPKPTGKTAQEQAAENKANEEKNKKRIDAAKKLSEELKRLEKEREAIAFKDEAKRVEALANNQKAYEDVRNKIDDDRRKRLKEVNEEIDKIEKEKADKQLQERIDREKAYNDKVVSMANTTAAALSTPFQQFGQDLLAGNKSLASSFEDLFGNIAASFANMLIQMASEMLAKAAIFTLFNALTGGGFGAASGGIGAFTGLSSLIPGFATGTNYAPGGIALVGEQGPELVQLPRGSKVRTARETAQSGITQVVNIYNQNLSEKQITDIVVKSQRKITLESKWRRTNV